MKVKITYLQLLARPQWAVLPPRDGLAVVHAKKPPVASYRLLYVAHLYSHVFVVEHDMIDDGMFRQECLPQM